ncbi:Transcriptional activator FeaR [Acinetobacter calcoaceticus]|nr:Transcriptional activator FeaR [Acinetobacter calcoaceticus]
MNQYVSDALLNWTTHIKNVCGNFETDFDGTRNLFIGEVQCFLLGDTEIAFIRNNANKIVRKADEIDRVNNRFCFLILQYSGKMLLEYKNETLSLNEGDIVLVDPVETISMYPQGLVSQISVHLSREKLLKENISTEYFGKLITQNMSGFLLKNILKNMSAENIKLWYATEDGNAFEDALIALIKPTINYKNINSSNNLMEKAERYIIENLAKPDLTPKLIAEHIGVSLRHLYRLFLQENLSINKYIQLKRLEKVKADLLDKRNKQSSITQIALKWGFWDGAHFSKIFKKTYGLSPKEFREGMSA